MAILAQRAREAGRLLSSLVLRKERAVPTWEQQEDAFMEGAKLVAGLNMAERSRMAHETEEKAMGELFDEEDIPRWRRGGRRHEDYPDSMEAEAHAPALFAAKPATELTPQDVALTSALQRLALDDDAGDHAHWSVTSNERLQPLQHGGAAKKPIRAIIACTPQTTGGSCATPCHVKRDRSTWADELAHPNYQGVDPQRLSHDHLQEQRRGRELGPRRPRQPAARSTCADVETWPLATV